MSYTLKTFNFIIYIKEHCLLTFTEQRIIFLIVYNHFLYLVNWTKNNKNSISEEISMSAFSWVRRPEENLKHLSECEAQGRCQTPLSPVCGRPPWASSTSHFTLGCNTNDRSTCCLIFVEGFMVNLSWTSALERHLRTCQPLFFVLQSPLI